MSLNDISIKNKVRIISIVPLFFVVVFSFYLIQKSYKEQFLLEQIKEIIVLNTKISELLHETQKERGLSAGFVGSKGSKFKDTLEIQRKLTDTKIKEFTNTYNLFTNDNFPNNSKKLLEQNIKELKNLDNFRVSVDNLQV